MVGIDTAFLVHNDRTYPTLCRLFGDLGIATQETDMSMSVRDDGSGLEYAGARGIGGLFPSWSTLARPRYLLMLAEVRRFHRAAARLLRDESADDDETLASFLERHGFSQYFIDHFMTPLVAAVWSSRPGDAMRYPARYLFVFLDHHGMLSVFGSPTLAHRHRRVGQLRRGDRDATARGRRRRSGRIRCDGCRRVCRSPSAMVRRDCSTPRSSPPTRIRRC